MKIKKLSFEDLISLGTCIFVISLLLVAVICLVCNISTWQDFGYFIEKKSYTTDGYQLDLSHYCGNCFDDFYSVEEYKVIVTKEFYNSVSVGDSVDFIPKYNRIVICGE